ncbi:MAG: ATP phosphoribosyltransferase regulatory subunit [Ruminococcaceae bacterium]|nr:ATP phosphoribosyltransferase regulatory subunit [Oscillospiraceae bacterium]
MKKYDLLTPEGTRDLLFDESVARRTVEDKLQRLFKSYGYSEVITPGLEFYDVFMLKSRYFSQESMYKLSDGKGRLMVIRPDSTMPIARLSATRLKDEIFPLKLFYNQNIFRINPKDSGRDDEITQSGVELIGGDPKKADLEILNLATEALTSLETGDFRFEIGDSALFKILISRVTSDEEETEAIREYIENKNIPELKTILEKYGDSDDVKALYSLPKLFGGIEIYDRALELFKDKETLEVLRDIKQAYDYLCYLGFEDKVTLDLGLVNKANYYTGLLFRGYIEGYGMPVLSGGRYDALMGDFGSTYTATGFAVNVNAVARVLLKNNTADLIKPAEVLVYSDSDAAAQGFAYCRELVSKGICAENAIQNTFEEALDYGQKKGIGKIAKVNSAGKVEEIKIL